MLIPRDYLRKNINKIYLIKRNFTDYCKVFLSVGNAIGATMVVENVFAYPGLVGFCEMPLYLEILS